MILDITTGVVSRYVNEQYGVMNNVSGLHGGSARKNDRPVYTYFLAFLMHDDVIKWKHFPRWWPFVRGIHRSPANSPHKGQWRRALMFPLFCVWTNDWVNNRDAGDLRRHRAYHNVTVMVLTLLLLSTETGELSWCHLWHIRLLFWQPPMPPDTTKLALPSNL